MKKLILILVLFCSCEEALEKDYAYEVTGTSGDYNVTLQNADDNTQQWASVGSGWRYTFNQVGTRWLYISAQNNTDQGNVTVRIYKDGRVIAENTSYGGYSIATVSGNY